jgi:branched-chain amino acid transport system ATP-binding protein
MLEVDDLAVAYGNIAALRGISLKVHAGEIVALIGSNGSGKSTLIKALAGLVKPQQGEIRLLGQSLLGQPICEHAPASPWCRRTGVCSARCRYSTICC